MKLVYTEAELMSNHDYATPHVIDGRRMHGGFDANGVYVPPRAKRRNEALDAWTAALRQRGGNLFGADASLLTGARMPNVEQQRLLIRNGSAADVLERPHDHRQDRGARSRHRRHQVSGSAEDHQRRHLADVDRPSEQGAVDRAWSR